MQFQVPQFIETEDKIVGPLTLKEFLYLAAGGGISFVLYFFFTTWLWLFVSAIAISVSICFAFIKINGRPLPEILIAAGTYYWKPRLYLWQKQKNETGPIMPRIPSIVPKRPILESLWQQLTTSKAPIPQREKILKPSILDRVRSSKERFEMIRKISGDREVSRRVDYR